MTATNLESANSHAALPGDQQSSTQQGGTSLWSLVDDRLRGRWTIAIVVGVVLAAIFGPAGYLSTHPKYQSVGFIRIAPKLEPILRETVETSLMPFFDGFVRTQAELIASRRVLERARADESLARLNCTVRQLQRGLTVTAARNTELIVVQFDAESPELTQVAVNAVIDAYYEIFGSAGGDDVRNKLQTLRARQRDLRSQIREKGAQLVDHASTSEYGAVEINMLITERVAQIDALEAQIGQIEHVLTSNLSVPAEGEQTSEAPPSAGLTSQQLDDFDPELASLRSTWRLVSSSFEHAKQRWRPTHPTYQRLQEELALIEKRIEAREAITRPLCEAAQLRQFVQSQYSGAIDLAGLGMSQYTTLTRRQIEIKLEGLRHAAAQARRNVQQMFSDQRRRDEISSEAEYLKQDLAEVEDRIMYLEIEEDSVSTGRVSIAARGDRPVAPATDRRPELAALGIVGGLGLSFGFFFLLGTIDPRAYRAAQLRGGRIPRCLGVLPDLGRGRPDPETCTVAAHCVHQVRNHIEVLRENKTGFVLAVSSPYQGDGKTNIVMALGWSYATAGHRTLLVDCDFTGTSLTQQMGMSGRPGLKEALREGHANGHVLTHRIPELSILPAGSDPDVGPETLRRTDLEHLFGELRRHFDIVIVDTGPMLASLEGIPVASAADHTILSIRRGRRRSLLEECTERLNAVGVSCLGVVLNYAARTDCDRYVSRSSLSVPHEESEKKVNALVDDSHDEAPTESAEHSALIRAMTAALTQTRVGRVPPQ